MICNFINSAKAQDWTPPNTSNVVITQDARVGVGVAQPSEALHVAGLVRIDSLANIEGKKYLLYVDELGVIHMGAEYKPDPRPANCSATFTYWKTNGNSLTGTGLLNNPPCEFIGSINEFPLNFRTNNEERLRIETDGNLHVFQKIGIATTNYAAQLNFSLNDGTQKFIEGLHNNQKTFSVYGDGRTVINSTQNSEPILEINQSTHPIFYAYADRIGIGTVFPDNFYGQGSALVRIQGRNNSTNRYAIIHFQNVNATNTGSLEVGQNGQNAVINSFGTNLVINYHENKPIDIYGKTTINKGLVAKNDNITQPVIEVESYGNHSKRGISIYTDHSESQPLLIRNTSNDHVIPNFQVYGDGRTQINTSNSTEPAFEIRLNGTENFQVKANGDVHARRITTTINNFPDYVFDKNYPLMPLKELKNFVEKHKHLPNVPSAKQVEQNGVELGELNKVLLEKIEELTLYILQLEERIKQLEK